MRRVLAVCLLAGVAAAAQQIPAPTNLPGDPFLVKKTWQISGGGNSLNTMVLDPVRPQLFLSFRFGVEVYDLESGTHSGQVAGVSGSYGIAVDDTGEFGFVSDGQSNQIDVFDQRTHRAVGIVPTAHDPTTVVYEPRSALIFVVCSEPTPGRPVGGESTRYESRRTIDAFDWVPQPPNRTVGTKPAANKESKSYLTVFDANSWTVLANIQLPGKVGFVQTAGNGHVYIGIPNRREVARLDALALGDKLRNGLPPNLISGMHTRKEEQLRAVQTAEPGGRPRFVWWRVPVQMLDWSGGRNSVENDHSQIKFFSLAPECGEPRTLAVDERHVRLFVACSNMTLAVLNADNGDPVASVLTGPGTNAIAYDLEDGLIYAANGEVNGGLTIIRQDVTDTYSVIQNLPTYHWARALTVSPTTGQAYLATDYSDLDPNQEGRLAQPNGSFHVQVIGH